MCRILRSNFVSVGYSNIRSLLKQLIAIYRIIEPSPRDISPFYILCSLNAEWLVEYYIEALCLWFLLLTLNGEDTQFPVDYWRNSKGNSKEMKWTVTYLKAVEKRNIKIYSYGTDSFMIKRFYWKPILL